MRINTRCIGLRFLHLFVIELNVIYLKLSDEASEGLQIDSIWFRHSSGLWSGAVISAFAP